MVCNVRLFETYRNNLKQKSHDIFKHEMLCLGTFDKVTDNKCEENLVTIICRAMYMEKKTTDTHKLFQYVQESKLSAICSKAIIQITCPTNRICKTINMQHYKQKYRYPHAGLLKNLWLFLQQLTFSVFAKIFYLFFIIVLKRMKSIIKHAKTKPHSSKTKNFLCKTPTAMHIRKQVLIIYAVLI